MPAYMDPHTGDKRKSDAHDLNVANRKRPTLGSSEERRNGGQVHKEQYWMVMWYDYLRLCFHLFITSIVAQAFAAVQET